MLNTVSPGAKVVLLRIFLELWEMKNHHEEGRLQSGEAGYRDSAWPTQGSIAVHNIPED